MTYFSPYSIIHFFLMKEITINRPNEQWNKFVSYKVFVDGQLKATIHTGEQQIIQVPKTAKQVQAKIHWVGSKPKQLTNTNTIVVQANQPYHLLIFIGALLPLVGVVAALFPSGAIICYALIALLLLFVIAMATVAKNNWLTLSVS